MGIFNLYCGHFGRKHQANLIFISLALSLMV